MLKKLYRNYEKIIYYLLLCAIILVPLIFYLKAQNIVLIKIIILQTIVFGSFLLWLTMSFYGHGNFKLPKLPINMPLIILFLYYVFNTYITVIRTPYDPYVIEEMSRFTTYFLLVLLIARFVNTDKKMQIALYIFAVIGFIVSIYYYGQRVLNRDFISEILSYIYGKGIYIWGSLYRVPDVSTFGSKNFFVGYILIPVYLCFGFALFSKRLFAYLFFLASGIFLVICIFLSRNAPGFIALSLTFPLFLIIIIFNFRIINKYFKITLIIIIIGIMILIIFQPRVNLIIKNKLSEIKYAYLLFKPWKYKRGTNLVRLRMWEGAMRAAEDHPIIGAGLGGFQLFFPYYRPDDYHRSGVSHNTRHSHNEYLEILSETGVVGLILFMGLFVTIIVTGIKLLFYYSEDRYYPVIAGLLCGILTVCIKCLFSVGMRWTAPAFSYWLGVGLLFAFVYLDEFKPEKSESKYLGRTIFVLFMSIIILSGYIYYAHKTFVADKHLIRGMNLLNNNKTVDYAIEECEKTIELNPFEISGMYKGAYGYLRKNDFNNALRLYKNIIYYAPNYAQIHNNIGIAETRLGDYALGMAEFERATNIEDNYRNHIALAQRWMQFGYTDKTLYHLFRIRLIEHDNPRGDGRRYLYCGYDTAYNLEAMILSKKDMDNPEIEKLSRRAVSVNPFEKKNYTALADYLKYKNRDAEAEQVLEESKKFDIPPTKDSDEYNYYMMRH